MEGEELKKRLLVTRKLGEGIMRVLFSARVNMRLRSIAGHSEASGRLLRGVNGIDDEMIIFVFLIRRRTVRLPSAGLRAPEVRRTFIIKQLQF